MRAVCFVERRELDFPGSICKNALVFGDVNGDGESELSVGNQAGELAVYKKNSTKPWFRTAGLKFISALGVGPLVPDRASSLVVVSGDGWCHVLLAGPPPTCTRVLPPSPDTNMHVALAQRVPPNCHCLVLGDIDGDGATELMIGLTDRVVRSYRWQPDPPPSTTGSLVSVHKWETASQVGSVSLGREVDGLPSLLVSQPGGTFLRITCKPTVATEAEPTPPAEDISLENGGPETVIEYEPLASARMRNPNVSTEIAGGVRAPLTPGRGSPYAVATIDGTLMLVQDHTVIWSIQLHRQLFSLASLDVTGDGRDEIVVCSWDGQTYILGQDQVSVRFQFEESVAAFCAGRFGKPKPGEVEAAPCLVYGTFSNKLHVFPDLNLKKLRASSLDQTSLGLWPGLTRVERQKAVAALLYGPWGKG